jgi:AraC-like DNA-binding protein
VSVASATHRLTRGHAFVIPSGVPHAYGAALDDPWTIHWVHFRGEIAYQFVQQMRDGSVVIPVDVTAHVPIVQTFQECYAALASSFGVRQVIFCAMEIHRILGWLFFRNEAFAANQADLPGPVKKALAYMRDNVQQRPSLAHLAAHAGVSVSHFSFLFKASLGTAPIDYFIELKMQYACHLLETSSLTVKQVAFALSYDDPYYFSRLFRNVIGMSPVHYRKGGRV